MTNTLKGIRVVELGTSIAAPYGAWILGAMGAEVIKVERPGKGDDARTWGSDYHSDGASLWFHSVNTNKKSVVVDLKNTQEVDRLRRFITSEVDVVIQNHKPGRVQKLGLDAETLRKENPALIYCNIGAFGREGPLKDRPGYDPLMQAFGGMMSITGHAGQPPVRTGFSAVDQGTGMWCVIGVLGALHRRDVTGVGGVVDTALFETAVGWSQIVSSSVLNGGAIPRGWGSGVAGIVPYQAFECADGYLVIGGGNDSLFKKISAALDQPQWAEDERFATNPARITNRDLIVSKMTDIIKTRSRAHWGEIFDAAGVPNAAIQDLAEVMAHEQTRALGLIQQFDDGVELSSLPMSTDGQRPQSHSLAPTLGEHTDELLGPHS